MSNWISITLQNLYDAKVGALIDACDQAALADKQKARTPGIIQAVVDEIRRKVSSHQRNQVDADITTIPKGLLNMAVDMIIDRLKTSLEMEQTPAEKANLELHAANLNRIADGKDVVDAPDNAIIPPMEPLVPPPSFGNFPCRRRNEMNG